MRSNIILLMCLLVAVGTAVAQPKMEIVGGETVDWGRMVVKDNPLKMVTLDTNLTIKNTGNKDLIIDTIKVGCGCTTPKYSTDPIKPGKTSVIHVLLNAALASGDLTKTMTIFTNDDPSKTGRLLYLKANLFRPITLTPQTFNFPEIKVGETSKFSVAMKNNDTKPLKVERLLATKGLKIDQKGPVTIAAGDSLVIHGTYYGKDRGYWSANVVVETADPDFPPFEISAYGQVKDEAGVVDPSVIQIDPSKAKNGKIELPNPNAVPAAPPKKK